mgnify:FL=1
MGRNEGIIPDKRRTRKYHRLMREERKIKKKAKKQEEKERRKAEKKKPEKKRGSRKDRKGEKGQKEKRLSAQKSIPYREMARDGICRVQDRYYSKTIRFYDINYQLAQNEDKNAIFENWCDFLNYFDSSIHFQLSFINHHSSMNEFESVIQIKPRHDAFDEVRMEYVQMLRNQLAKGNNGLVRTKYITFGIEAENYPGSETKAGTNRNGYFK